MSKFVQHASYYLDDKDLSDLFTAQNVSPRFLLRFARRRGLFLSDKGTKEDLVRALCMAPISWEDVSVIAEAINSEDRDTKQMTVQLTSGVDFSGLPAALERVKSWLEANREIPTITKVGDNAYKLEVGFLELQPQRTRPLQRVERRVTIEIEQVEGRLDIRFSAHEHARQIVRKLVGEIPSKQDDKKSERTVSLWSVHEPLLRIKFFTDLINNIDGFVLSEVTDLQVDRRFPTAEKGDADENQQTPEDDEQKKEAVGLVKRAILSGESLLNSDFYRKLRDAGYYIGSVIWTANELGGARRQVEFSAGFKDPILATDFIFDIRRVAKRDKDGEYGKPERNQPVDRPRLLKLIEAGAYTAMENIASPPLSPDREADA